MQGNGTATGASDSTGGAGGTGDPAAGTGTGASDSAGDVERLTRALEAERAGHAATQQQLAQLRNQGQQQQGGAPVTQPQQGVQQGQQATGQPEDRMAALIAQVQALTERAEAAEQAAIRGSVATKFGLTDAQAARLVGKTKAELEADAESLAKDFGIKVPGAGAAGDGAGAGAAGGDGAAGDATNGTVNGKAPEGSGAGASRRTTGTLRPGAANEDDKDRGVSSQKDADKIAEEILGVGF